MTTSVPRFVPLYGDDFALRQAIQAHATPARLSSMFRLWFARSSQRRALSDLSECNSHLLADIGVTPDQAAREASKWFWQK